MIETEAVTTEEQIACAADLAVTIWNDHFVPIIGQAQVEYMLEAFQSPTAIAAQMAEGVEYFLARVDRQPAGYTAVIPHRPAGRLMLSKLYVKRECRGSGVGGRLLALSGSRAVESELGVVWLTVNRHNGESIAWYQRRGFRVVDEVVKPIGGGFVMDDLVLETPAEGLIPCDGKGRAMP